MTGITTVADFRRRDVADGGEGAPLAPAFHQWMFASPDLTCGVLNIGGIANLSVLRGDDPGILGFDTGPGNGLIDAWIRQQKQCGYDARGEWAASGKIRPELLQTLLADDYFRAQPPKSTGFEYFNLDWLMRHADPVRESSPADVQATLAELTACSVAKAVARHAPEIERLFVCGGGVHNDHLMARLQFHLPDTNVASTADAGLDPDWVEAVAFAWLAMRRLEGLPGNLPSVTGAGAAAILGGVYN